MEDGEHLWDLRFGVLFEDGRASVYPVSLRLAPPPFDERSFHLDRDRWISNVSGRTTTLLRSGLDDRALEAVGMTPDKVDLVARACATWTARAWDGAVRDAGPTGVAYEDACEAEDAAFYPRDGFARR
jgi:hypothetical protein